MASSKEVVPRAFQDFKTENGDTLQQIPTDGLQEYRPQLHYDACVDVLQRYSNCPVPGAFLVLPINLESWDDLDPTTHKFRLYFICDVKKEDTENADEWQENDVWPEMYENDETGATDEMDETDDLDDALSPSNSHQFILPQHVHFSNHTGYDLVRSQEFFQTYGFYILMVLKMVRDGFSSDDHEIPSLENFEILWGVDLDGCGGYLTKDTIGTLVSKAINYLEGLKLQKYRSEVWLKESECVAIKDFLVVPSGNNTLGGLYRRSNVISFPTAHHQYANVFRIWTWTCKQHAHQWITPGSHKALEDFVYGCGGHVDLQLATVSIKLQSKQQAEVFCNLLEKTGQRFHVLITLDWNVDSRRGLLELLQKITYSDVQHLELDGVPHGVHPQQGIMDYRADFFASYLASNDRLLSLTLFNYPEQQEQCTYFGKRDRTVFKIHSKQKQPIKVALWLEILRLLSRDYVRSFVDDWGGARSVALHSQLKLIQDFLAKAGYPAYSTVSCHQSDWSAEFDLKEGTLPLLRVYDLSVLDKHYRGSMARVPLEILESLRILVVDVDGLEIDQEINCMVQASPVLERLDISFWESGALERVEKVLEVWYTRTGPLQLTLTERDIERRGRLVCQVIVRGNLVGNVRGCSSGLQGSDTLPASSQEWRQVALANIEFLQWNNDHISVPLADLTAVLLEKATECNSTVLTSFVLDVSNLSCASWIHAKNVLRNSMLRTLHIVCTSFDPDLHDFVRQVLLSIQWPTLQSLTVSGMAANEWIELWMTISIERSITTNVSSLLDMQLQSFRIQGSGIQPVYLSHSSALFVHQLVYLNPPMELILENVFFQDNRDWAWFAEKASFDPRGNR